MTMSNTAVRNTLTWFLKSSRAAESLARGAHHQYESVHHSVANVFPAAIRPRRYRITMALTAQCNARCIGCRYGRDFMHGEILPLKLVDGVLEDARAAGFRVIRLYGGEPLLHRDLPQIVRRCGELGLKPYLTTNAVLLDRKIDSLFDVGLRDITVGFYGVDAAYDWYVQTPGLYKRVEHSIAAVRQRYADKVTLQMNWLLMRPSCNSQSLRNVCEFAERYNMKIQIDLIH
jgi:cyclic pyranopterin phosphate synthase